VVEKCEDGTDFWEKVPGTIPSSKNSHVVKDLEPGKKYKFRVKAENKFGPGQPVETNTAILAKNPYGNFTGLGLGQCASDFVNLILTAEENYWKIDENKFKIAKVIRHRYAVTLLEFFCTLSSWRSDRTLSKYTTCVKLDFPLKSHTRMWNNSYVQTAAIFLRSPDGLQR